MKSGDVVVSACDPEFKSTLKRTVRSDEFINRVRRCKAPKKSRLRITPQAAAQLCLILLYIYRLIVTG